MKPWHGRTSEEIAPASEGCGAPSKWRARHSLLRGRPFVGWRRPSLVRRRPSLARRRAKLVPRIPTLVPRTTQRARSGAHIAPLRRFDLGLSCRAEGERPMLTPEDLWNKLVEETGEEEITTAASVSASQAERDLRAAGFDVKAEREQANAVIADLTGEKAPASDRAAPTAWVTGPASAGRRSPSNRRAVRSPWPWPLWRRSGRFCTWWVEDGSRARSRSPRRGKNPARLPPLLHVRPRRAPCRRRVTTRRACRRTAPSSDSDHPRLRSRR